MDEKTSNWSIWRQQAWLKVLWLISKLITVRPFLKVDPNAYCPACGHRRGRILSVTDGHAVTIRHLCDKCQWLFDEPTVTKIDPASIVPLPKESDEPLTEEELLKPQRQFERFIRINPGQIKVNGEPIKP